MLFGVLFRGTFAILSVQDTLSPKDSMQSRGHREKNMHRRLPLIADLSGCVHMSFSPLFA